MIGKNGKKSNMNNKSVIIFEDSINITEILELQKNTNLKIISMNYSSHKILEDNKIQHILSDDFLTDEERTKIQNQAYKLSDWSRNSLISNYLLYEGINLGSLIKLECINIFVNFIKKFFEFYKISKENPECNFYCSKESKEILENFTKKILVLKSINNVQNFSPIDSLKVKHSFRIKNFHFEINFSKKLFTSIKLIIESITNFLINSKPLKSKSKCMLFSEFNTINLRHFLNQNEYPFVLYNRRQPAIWNKQTLSIIKNSKAIIENQNTLISKTIKENSLASFKKFENHIDELFDNNSIFTDIFKIENMSFWHLIRENFIELIKSRTKQNIFEIELAKKLFEKYNFSGVIINNDVGPHERILSQLAKRKNIPIFLNQHGLIFDTDDAFERNLHGGVISPESDFSFVWGEIDEKYRLSSGIEKNKIVKIGCSTFDNIETTVPAFNEKDYVVLATQSPTDENIFDLSPKIRQKNIDTIKYVCKLITELNLDLVIKIHPDPNEFNPSKIAHEINPKIRVIQNTDFASVIKNAKFVIVIDFSTIMLDCYLLKKPIISLNVKNKHTLPTGLKNNSCLYTELNNLEETIKKLDDPNVFEKKIQDGLDSASQYLSFINSGSQQLSLILKKYTEINCADS